MTDTPDPRPYAMVTMEHLALELRSMRDTLTAIATRLDAVVQAHESRLADHEARIRALERAAWSRAGLVGITSAVLTALITYATTHGGP